MSTTALYIADIAAILVLVFVLYFPRHRRRDMVVAYLVANLGVLAVASALSSSTIAAGLGLGLFGILSIIRLRSAELDQAEIAYYFAALAIGLLAGISVTPGWLTLALVAATVLGLYIGDHPHLFGRYRIQKMTLDRAYASERELIAALESTLEAKVHRVRVRNLDQVRDTTTVEVRFELPLQESRTREHEGVLTHG